MTDRLQTGQRLEANAQLTSPSGLYSLYMQGDGNLVLYRGVPAPETAYWSSDTWALPEDERPVVAVMQADASLVLLDALNQIRWSSGTWGPGYDAPTLVLQDDGNLVIYQAGGQVVWASGMPGGDGAVGGQGFRPALMTRPFRTPFNARLHGFKFRNGFTNPIVRIPELGIDISTRGRCGGMAYAALDYYFHGLPVPDLTTLPPDGTLLADYIYARLADSMVGNGAMNFHFMRTPDHPTVVNGIGVARATREEQWPRLMRLLDSGRPCMLGLTQARDVGGLGNDHQVVAYGYRHAEPYSQVLVWDNNHPNAETVLSFKTAYDPGEREITDNNGGVWRGFFVEVYEPRQPPYLTDGKLLKEATQPPVYVVRRGGIFHIPSAQEFEESGYSWSAIQTVQDGSAAGLAAYPGDGSLVQERGSPAIHVVFGGTPFHIPSPPVFESLGYQWADVIGIPSGALAAARRMPIDGTLLREQNHPEVYVVDDGWLRHVPTPAEFEARGYVWSNVRVVPDEALAGLDKGPPLEITPPDTSTPPRSWAQRLSGGVYTADGDVIDFQIEAGAVPSDQVEFVLKLGSGLTWRKELVLKAQDGQWTIHVENDRKADANGLYRYQLPAGSLVFRKAKFLGVMTDIHGLGSLDDLPAGARVSFTWVKD